MWQLPLNPLFIEYFCERASVEIGMVMIVVLLKSTMDTIERQNIHKAKLGKSQHSHFKVWLEPSCAFLKADFWQTWGQRRQQKCPYDARTSLKQDSEKNSAVFLDHQLQQRITVWRLQRRGAREEKSWWSTELAPQQFELHKSPRRTCWNAASLRALVGCSGGTRSCQPSKNTLPLPPDHTVHLLLNRWSIFFSCALPGDLGPLLGPAACPTS